MENIQAVYNWQFVHSIELWGAVLSSAADSELLRPLIYPFVQVTIGTIKLVESPKFFPLKFHCAKVLTQVSVHTRTFIPILPIYIHILNNYNFSKKSKKMSFKPMDFTCVLKVTKANQLLSGFRDAIIEEAYGGILTYLAMHSHKIGFPELVTPMVVQLRKFFKKCKSASHSKPIKQCVEKAMTNAKLIEQKRRSVTFGVGDAKEIQIWEAKVERDGTPIKAFYESWKKASDKRRLVRISKDFKGIDYTDVPIIDKAKIEKRKQKQLAAEEAKKKDGEEERGFLSGEESDDVPDEERFRTKDEKELKKKAKLEKKTMEKAAFHDSDDNDDSDNDDDDEDDDGSDMEDDGDDQDGSESEGEEEKEEGEDGGDEVQDLNLEDLDQFDEEDEAMKDDFGVGDDDDDNDDDSSPDDDDDDDDSD